MSANGKDIIRVGNIGVITRISMRIRDPNDATAFIALDLTPVAPGGTTQIQFMRPNGSKFLKTSIIEGSPTLGVITHTDTSGDVYNNTTLASMTKRGSWQARGVIVYNDSTKFIGSWHRYAVGD